MSLRTSLFCLSGLLFLGACNDSSPTRPTPDLVDVEFVYFSTVIPGDSVEAGFCAHHQLGSSWIQLWIDGAAVDSYQLRAADDPKTWRGRGQGLPVGRPLVAVIQDLECCSHDGPCQPTEALLVNGFRLQNVVEVTDQIGVHLGLGFRLDSSGSVLQ